METKANYLMIGGFVLGVLAFAFIFVFWMSNFAGGGKRYYVVFENSVAGLTTGSSVGRSRSGRLITARSWAYATGSHWRSGWRNSMAMAGWRNGSR